MVPICRGRQLVARIANRVTKRGVGARQTRLARAGPRPAFVWRRRQIRCAVHVADMEKVAIEPRSFRQGLGTSLEPTFQSMFSTDAVLTRREPGDIDTRKTPGGLMSKIVQ